MIQEIGAALETLCNCVLSSSNMFNWSVSCEPGDYGAITFEMSFAFSNAEGSQTASSLAVEAEQWIVGERNVSGTLFSVELPSSKTTTTPNDQVCSSLSLSLYYQV